MIQYIEITPTADEFNILTDSVGWGCDDRKIVEKALKNTVYSICAYDDNKIILPIWHNINAQEVSKYSHYLADKMALQTSLYSVKEIARELAEIAYRRR